MCSKLLYNVTCGNCSIAVTRTCRYKNTYKTDITLKYIPLQTENNRCLRENLYERSLQIYIKKMHIYILYNHQFKQYNIATNIDNTRSILGRMHNCIIIQVDFERESHYKWWCPLSTWILFQFLYLMEKSILYAKITVQQIIFFSKFSFKYYIGLLFS